MSKVVLITGGSSGIGKAIGEFLVNKDFKVYGTSRTPENYNDSMFPILELDVKNISSIEKAVKRVIEKHGRLDVLVNNAGVGITGPIEEIPEKEIRNHFDTNFFGPINMIKAVLPHMRERGSGLIINVTSIAGYMGLPYRGFYSASKGALELLTEAFRMEIKGFNIQMTNIAPGDFATNIASGRYHAPARDNSPYKEAYKNTLDIMNSHVDKGSNPLEMAKVVYYVIKKKHPKGHYKVGSFLQKISIVLKRILPDKTYERMLMKHYKL